MPTYDVAPRADETNNNYLIQTLNPGSDILPGLPVRTVNPGSDITPRTTCSEP